MSVMEARPEKATIFIVDDDEQARKSVCALVKSMGLQAEAFSSAEEFLAQYDPNRSGCLVTDLRMPGMSGLELQERLGSLGSPLPVIVLTAYARTPSTVKAIQAGAVNVLDRPYQEDALCDAIHKALAEAAARRDAAHDRQAFLARLEQLSPTARQVLDLIVKGAPNKAIARTLGVSLRTVANRRAELLEVFGASSTAELITRTMKSL